MIVPVVENLQGIKLGEAEQMRLLVDSLIAVGRQYSKAVRAYLDHPTQDNLYALLRHHDDHDTVLTKATTVEKIQR